MVEEIKVGYYLLQAEQGSAVNRVEVMAIVKNYVMWRRKGCLPNAQSIKSFLAFLNEKKACPVKK